MNVVVSDDAEQDILDGIAFYDANGAEIGDYFYISILADLQALTVLGGIHSKRFGYHCMPAKRFPSRSTTPDRTRRFTLSRFWMNGEILLGSSGG